MSEEFSVSKLTPQMELLQLNAQPSERVEHPNRKTDAKPHAKARGRAVVSFQSQPRIPRQEDMFVFPYPPPDFETAPRYYFFGWPITDSRLTEIVRANCRPLGNGYTMCDGLRFLVRKSGYRYIYPVDGLMEDGDKYEHAFPSTHKNSKDLVFHAVTVHVNHKQFYHRKPTKAQMKVLEELIGFPARWFKDGQPPRKFSVYGMDEWSPSPY